MKALASLQRAFQRHVDRPGRSMPQAVRATPRADASRRLGIYADGYRARLVEALGKDYEALAALLGERAFRELAIAFIAEHPSCHPNLRWYGSELARFLARATPWSKRPLLAEIAAFEWALGLAFDAADSPVAAAKDMTGMPATRWPTMRFVLHASVHLLRLRTNAPAVWKAMSNGQRVPRSSTSRESTVWLVWRAGLSPRYRRLQSGEAAALSLAGRGRDFASICNAARKVHGVLAAAHAAQLLRNWLDEGLVCRVE